MVAFIDTFSDGVINPNIWDNAGMSAGITEQSGYLRLYKGNPPGSFVTVKIYSLLRMQGDLQVTVGFHEVGSITNEYANTQAAMYIYDYTAAQYLLGFTINRDIYGGSSATVAGTGAENYFETIFYNTTYDSGMIFDCRAGIDWAARQWYFDFKIRGTDTWTHRTSGNMNSGWNEAHEFHIRLSTFTGGSEGYHTLDCRVYDVLFEADTLIGLGSVTPAAEIITSLSPIVISGNLTMPIVEGEIITALPALDLKFQMESLSYVAAITSHFKHLELSFDSTISDTTPDPPEEKHICFSGETVDWLASIDPADSLGGGDRPLGAGDTAIVVNDNVNRFYILRESPGAVHTPPWVVVPSTSPGDLWWDLQDFGIADIERFTESTVAQNDERTITHAADSAHKRMVTLVADGFLTHGYQVGIESDTQIKIKKLSAGTDSELSIRVMV